MLHLYLRRFLPYPFIHLKTLLVGVMIFSLCSAMFSPARRVSAQGQCTIGCKATVPATAPVNEAVPFTSEVTSEGCAITPAYEWEFGDGLERITAQNSSHKYVLPGTYNWRLTSSAARIDTVAGGFGEKAPAKQAPLPAPSDIALDPQGRGFYVALASSSGNSVRFINTTNTEVTIGGQKIAAGTVQRLVGEGITSEKNIPGRQYDVGFPIGIAVSANGNLLYVLDNSTSSIHVYNASNETQSICDLTIDSGRAARLYPQGFERLGSNLRSIAVHPNGELYVADASNGINKIFKVSLCDSTPITVAGNGVTTRPEAVFTAGAATSTPLLQPSAITFDGNGNLYIADTGHARVVKVDSAGQATLVAQFPTNRNPTPTDVNPFPNGLAFVGDNLYVVMGSQQTIVRLGAQPAIVAGQSFVGCNYTLSNCGDGGPATGASFAMASSTDQPPVAGIESDGSGLLIADQIGNRRGRIRYLNLSAGQKTILDTTIAPGSVDTVAGNGLSQPSNGELAISAALNFPSGVAVDANNNLFVSDTLNGKLRFVNRGTSPVKIFANTAAEQTVQPGQIVTLNKDVGPGQTDGVPVNQAAFENLQGLAVTSEGLFIADTKKGPSIPALSRRSGLIRFVNTGSTAATFYGSSSAPVVIPPGNAATIVGGGANGATNGDGGLATNARLLGPTDVAVSPTSGDIYVASGGDKSVRKVNRQTGVISTLALPAASYTGLAFGQDGRLYIANESDGIVLRETAAGSGAFARMNSQAQQLKSPRDLTVDAAGNAYVTEIGTLFFPLNFGNRIARISPDGQVSTVAGKDEIGIEGDGGAALSAQLSLYPPDFEIGVGGSLAGRLAATAGITMSANNELFFCDVRNGRIRRITNLGDSCSQTGTITITGDNPVPRPSSMSPTTARVGDPAFTLTVRGSFFVAGSKVRWNGEDRPTTYLDGRLAASISAADLSVAGPVTVTVFSPAPGGGVSSPLVFTVEAKQNPVPVIQAIEPTSVVAGSPEFTLVVKGERFVTDSVVRWVGTDLQTTLVSDKELRAVVPAALIAKASTVQISVFTPTPGGGTSIRLPFQVKPNSVPKLTSVDPNRVAANSLVGTTLDITVNGESFVQTSVVEWTGSARPTRFINDKQLVFTITNDDVKVAGTAAVTVSNVESGGAVSNALNVTITAAPEIRTITPNAVLAGSPAFTMTIAGRNFSSGAEAIVGGKSRRTAVINAIELQVQIEAEDVANAGLVNIVVMGGPNVQLPRAVSNTVTLQVVSNVGSSLANVSAASFTGEAIAAESIVAAFGMGLSSETVAAAVVPLPTTLGGTRVVVKDSAGTERDAPLFFVSPTQINYLMPAGTATGLAIVRVLTGGASVASGFVQIATVAPGMFTANSTGDGLISGVALRVSGSGTPSFEPIMRFDATLQRFVPIPVDLGAATDQVYLIFFASGLRGRSNLSAVSVQVGGENIPVSYAGEVPGLAGVDQINLGPLPRTMAGRNLVNVSVTVDGKIANTTQVTIK